jgi:hypothetical protein
MHRLQEFAVGTIVPEWERVTRTAEPVDESERAMMALLIIESFLWLHLGVELGAFPRNASEDVFSFYYATTFRWLKSYDDRRPRSQRQPPFLDSAAYLGLPEFARALVRMSLDGGNPLYERPSGVGERPALVAPFQSLLILYSRLCRDTAARRFLFGIGFQNADDWRTQWSQPCTTEDLFKTFLSAEGSPAAMILLGYTRLSEYARNVNEVLKNIEDLGILDSARLFQFKDRIRNIHAWRLNLSSGDTAQRFDQVREQVDRLMDEALTPLAPEDDVKRVHELLAKSLELLFDSQPVLEPA